LFQFSCSALGSPFSLAEPILPSRPPVRAPARAAAVKDGARLRAHREARRDSVLDDREHAGKLQRFGTGPFRSGGSLVPG
jgi:hypothetical protein